MNRLITTIVMTVSATQLLAQPVLNLDQSSCFLAILASRPAQTLAPEVDAYLEGALAGAIALADDPAWLGRFTEICLADPNTSIADAISEAGAVGQ